jgi:hypothetical protein
MTDGSGVRQMSFPVALANAGAERFDVVYYLGARRRLPFADGGPDVHTVQRLALGHGCPSEHGKSWIHVYYVDHPVHSAKNSRDLSFNFRKRSHSGQNSVRVSSA